MKTNTNSYARTTSLLLLAVMGTLEAMRGGGQVPPNYMTADGNWGPYNGNPNIDEKHRECPTVLVIGMARRGKSTLCELLTGAGVFSDEHILRA